MAKEKGNMTPTQSHDAMVKRMIDFINRGPATGSVAKSIAKAGNVKEVLDYAANIHKFVLRYTKTKQARVQMDVGVRKVMRGGKKKTARSSKNMNAGNSAAVTE